MELCVAGSAIASSGRSHSSAWPLQRVISAGAGASAPPAATNAGERRHDQERRDGDGDRREPPARAHARGLGPRAAAADQPRRIASTPL